MPKMPTKKDLQKSEAWLSAITVIGAFLSTTLAHDKGNAKSVALFVVCLALAGVYAFFRTPLASSKVPGIKTKAFWSSLVVVVASMAAAIAETKIGVVPAGVTQTAGMVVAVVTALGYNVWRYKEKQK